VTYSVGSSSSKELLRDLQSTLESYSQRLMRYLSLGIPFHRTQRSNYCLCLSYQ